MNHRIAAALRGHAISVLAAVGATTVLALAPAPGWAQGKSYSPGPVVGPNTPAAAGSLSSDVQSTGGNTRSRPPGSPLPGSAAGATNGVNRATTVNGSAGTGTGTATSTGTPPGGVSGSGGAGTGSGIGTGGVGGAGASSTGGAGGVGGSAM